VGGQFVERPAEVAVVGPRTGDDGDRACHETGVRDWPPPIT